MRVDVSEIKTLRECRRKWGFSSRNFYHLRSRVLGPNLKFGIVFHEALHALYIGGPEIFDKVLDESVRELADDKSQQAVITSMLLGYASVLVEDLARFQVLDIEHSFSFELPELPGIQICGSIDMIAVDHAEQKLYGFEHKTCANFRPDYYNRLDEQPRLYYIALERYTQSYNEKHGTKYTVGGIYLNQVRKLQRKFEYSRGEALTYTGRDLLNFLQSFQSSCRVVESLTKSGLPTPEPGFMKCQMCDYRYICSDFGYDDKPLEELLSEFGEEFQVREVDHLEEKVERVVE